MPQLVAPQRTWPCVPAGVYLAFALALSGCAPHVRYISTPCIAKDQALPNEPDKIGQKLTGRADEDVKILAANAIRLRAYGRGLRTIIEGCRG